MRKRKIKLLNLYREILLDCKKIQILNQLDKEIENKFPSNNKTRQKLLTLFR